MLELSHSEIQTFRSCRRRWYITYYLELAQDYKSAPPTGNAPLGTRIHTAIEAMYAHKADPVSVLKQDYAEVIADRPDFEEDLQKERDLGVLMLEGFLDWAAETGLDAGYEIISAEHEERASIITADGQEVILRGKLDQLVRREFDDVLLCRDIKTVATLEKPDMLVLGTQLRHYALLQALNAKGTTQRVEGGIFVMLRRVKRGVSAKPPFYSMVEVHLNRHDLNSYYLHAREVATEILRARARLDAGEDNRAVTYASPSGFCNWGCDYKLQCPLFDDGSRVSDALNAAFIQVDPYARYDASSRAFDLAMTVS